MRNAKVTVEKNINISVDPEIAEAFKHSTSVSRKSKRILILSKINLMTLIFFNIVAKGVGFQMLRVGTKRRRTKGEIEAEKLEKRQKEDEIEQKLIELEDSKTEHLRLKQNAESHKNSTRILTDLQSKGKIRLNENNEVEVVPEANEMNDDN